MRQELFFGYLNDLEPELRLECCQEATRRQTFMKISRNVLNCSAKVGPESKFVTH